MWACGPPNAMKPNGANDVAIARSSSHVAVSPDRPASPEPSLPYELTLGLRSVPASSLLILGEIPTVSRSCTSTSSRGRSGKPAWENL